MSLEELAGELRSGMEEVRCFLDIERPSFPVEPEPDGYIENREPTRIMRGQKRRASPP
jgi:hypothetical protein